MDYINGNEDQVINAEFKNLECFASRLERREQIKSTKESIRASNQYEEMMSGIKEWYALSSWPKAVSTEFTGPCLAGIVGDELAWHMFCDEVTSDSFDDQEENRCIPIHHVVFKSDSRAVMTNQAGFIPVNKSDEVVIVTATAETAWELICNNLAWSAENFDILFSALEDIANSDIVIVLAQFLHDMNKEQKGRFLEKCVMDFDDEFLKIIGVL